MLGGLIASGYSVEDYDAELANVQEAFERAMRSSDDDAAAGLTALQGAFPSAGFELQDGALSRQAFDQNDKALLDDVLRNMLLRLASEAVEAGQPVMQYRGRSADSRLPVMQRLLGMCKWVTESSSGDAASGGPKVIELAGYCRMLEDLLELGTIGDCQDVFSCMEEDIAFLTSDNVASAAGTSGKPAQHSHAAQLTILRACNSLMRRLSKANDVQLCGRILVFIARVYPLSDKSGLNLHGAVNQGLPLPIDSVAPDALDVSSQPVDAKLYAMFWGLQAAFKAPGQLLVPAAWARFRNDLAAVLSAFEALPITVPASGPGSVFQQLPGCATGMDVDADGAGGAGGSPAVAASTSVKYLTSSKLFGLQVRDATFRRHFLVQCAALLHFMQHPTSRDTRGGAAAVAGAGLVAKPDGADELGERVLSSLVKTEGKADAGFAAAVCAVLERETHWVAWKKEGCPPFERPPEAMRTAPAELGPGSAATAGVARPAKRRRGAPAVPRPTFAQLITVPADQMAGLRAVERKIMPDLRTMLTPIVEDMDPAECIEEEYRRRKDKIFAWKASRMLARHNLPAYAACKDDLEEAVMRVYPEVRKKIDDYKSAEAERLKKLEETAAADAAAEVAPADVKSEAGKVEVKKEKATGDLKEKEAGDAKDGSKEAA